MYNPIRFFRAGFRLTPAQSLNGISPCLLVLLIISFLAKSRCLADALGDALDAPALTWTTGGSADWQVQTTTTHDGIDAANSGAIGSNSESWIQTTVTGPGTLTWWWKVSSEEDFDYLELHLDGTLQPGSISGEVAWVQVSREILPGSHTVKWRYQKDGSATDGADSGYLDEVVFTPAGPVSTGSATNISETGATLNGSVNPGGLVTTAYFEFGTTTAYGTTASVTLSPNNGNEYQQVSAPINGLLPATIYHYRLVASNSGNPAPGADQTFFTASPYTVSVSDNKVTITGYTGTDTNLVIPTTISGLPVTAIGTEAFAYNDALASVIIPPGVTSIDTNAFYSCDGLISATVPGTVTSLGYGIFYSCDLLTSVTLGSGLTTVGESMFQDCPSLTNINLPGSLTEIKSSAFNGCIALASVNIPATVNTLGSSVFAGCSALTGIALPAGLTVIPSSAFQSCTKLATATISGQVTSIGQSAFSGCSSLGAFTFPSSLSSLGGSAFSGCGSLLAVVVPSGVTTLPSYIFSGCSKLASVSLGGPVTSIGYGAFNGCQALSAITIPATVASIDGYAFYGCESLTTLALPAGLTSIGEAAFYDCDGLTSMIIPTFVTEIVDETFASCAKLASVILPSALTSIGYSAFEDCLLLNGVSLPPGLTSIGAAAFSNCRSLSAIVLPPGLTNLESSAFKDCPLISTIAIPIGVVSINSQTFSGCTGLTTVVLPANLISIQNQAFSGCSNLLSLNIPASVTSIGSGAFYNCSSLTSINIPNATATIGDSAFAECAALQSISVGPSNPNYSSPFGILFNKTLTTLIHCPAGKTGAVTVPATTTRILSSAFSGCSQLTAITLPGAVTDIGGQAFEDCSNLTTFVIPNGVTAIEYATFAGCSRLTSVTIPLSVEFIGEDAFYSCESLTSLTLPANLQEIGEEAFRNCAKITTVSIPATVYDIGSNSFTRCRSLTAINVAPLNADYASSAGMLLSKDLTILIKCPEAKTGAVVIPNGVNQIGSSSFRYCTGITSVVIPNGVSLIGSSGFRYCSGLKTVALPASLSSIDAYAFSGCTGISSITIPANVVWLDDNSFSGNTSLKKAVFQGHAPSMGSDVFFPAAPDFIICYQTGKKGFTIPTWDEGYPSRGFSSLTTPEIAVTRPPAINLADAGAAVSFGTVQVGAFASMVFTISNLGVADLTGLAITVDGTNKTDFTITANPVAPVQGPSGKTTFTVKFAPGAPGARSGAIRIACNDADENPFDILLSGAATAPEISVNSGGELVDAVSKLNFGNTLINTNSVKTVFIKNLGNAPLTGLSIRPDGPHFTNFTVSPLTTTSLLPGAMTSFTVTFRTPILGIRTAAIHIASNDGNETPFDIALTGTGTAPEISVNSGGELTDAVSIVQFGSSTVNSPVVKTFHIKNLGTAPLTGLAISRDGPHFTNYTESLLNVTSLAPGAVASFTVTFKPSAAGTRTAAIHISSNDANENKFDIMLTGVGNALAKTPKSTLSSPGINLTAVDDGIQTPVVKGRIVIDGKRFLTLTYREPAKAARNSCVVQVSSNLVDWRSGKNHTTKVSESGGLITIRDNVPLGSGTKRHIRLKTCSK